MRPIALALVTAAGLLACAPGGATDGRQLQNSRTADHAGSLRDLMAGVETEVSFDCGRKSRGGQCDISFAAGLESPGFASFSKTGRMRGGASETLRKELGTLELETPAGEVYERLIRAEGTSGEEFETILEEAEVLMSLRGRILSDSWAHRI